jgi:type VI protein secretion system component VasF
MYRDDESIRQFERQHARDVLIQRARNLADDADMDLVTGHQGVERKQDKLIVAISIIAAIVAIGLALYFVTTFQPATPKV